MNVTGNRCVVFSVSVPAAMMLKLYIPQTALPTVTINGAPPAVGTTLAGAAEHVGGAPSPQLRFTALSYPFSDVSAPLKFTVLFTTACNAGLLIVRA